MVVGGLVRVYPDHLYAVSVVNTGRQVPSLVPNRVFVLLAAKQDGYGITVLHHKLVPVNDYVWRDFRVDHRLSS